ncbi:helix-turn-helix domain-containing protein [Vreelandella populi]|uniref:helix-turn-helix domain-containing protein n=1 Tax=Vreelandella populi TaxID=2498858 RepID=UPI00163C6C14|nr:helix-turn-helix transcriptional regulator [Halomonas populi]
MDQSEFHIANKDWFRARFPERLREITRKAHGYSEGKSDRGLGKCVSDKTGIPAPTVSRYLSGSMLPGVDRLLVLADAYDTPVDYLAGNNDAPIGHFSMETLDQRIPRELLMHVLAMMAELRSTAAPGVSDKHFALSTVELLDKVSDRPDMNEHEMTGLGLSLLKGEPKP